MNVRTATVLEVDEDVPVGAQARAWTRARRPPNLRTADSGDLIRARREGRRRSRPNMRRRSMPGSRFPEEAIAAARAERLLGIAVPRELGGEGASIAERGRRLLHARPRLRVDRDDLCDASDQGSPAWYRHGRSAPGISSCCAGFATSNCCWHRRPPKARTAAMSATARRRSCATARASCSNGRRPSSPTARRPTPSSRPRAAPPTPRVPIRCSSPSSSRTTRSSPWSAGTRSACAAPAARVSSSSPPVPANRFCRWATTRFTPRP